MNSKRALDCIARVRDAEHFSPASLFKAMRTLRKALREAIAEVHDVRADLSDVSDLDDRQTAVVDLSGSVDGLLDELGKLQRQMDKVQKGAAYLARKPDEISRRLERLAGAG
jgi:chromosome segregation ATPase